MAASLVLLFTIVLLGIPAAILFIPWAMITGNATPLYNVERLTVKRQGSDHRVFIDQKPLQYRLGPAKARTIKRFAKRNELIDYDLLGIAPRRFARFRFVP